MKYIILLFLSSVATLILAHDVYFGSKGVKDQPIVRTRVQYNAIPWKKRVKYYFFNDPEGRPIKAILCFDYQRSTASVNITAGGIGYSYVNLRMKSQRSYGIEYFVEIYVDKNNY